MNTNTTELFDPKEMQSPFDSIKQTDNEGKEWWNSRKQTNDTYLFLKLQLSAAIKRILNPADNCDNNVNWYNCPHQFEKFEFLRTNGKKY